MSADLFLLVAFVGVPLAAIVIVKALMAAYARLTITLSLRFDRGLSYTWRRAWRRAGHHLADSPW